MSLFNLYIIFVVLAIHYIADFICQSHEDATKKSSSLNHLINHVYWYSSIVFVGLNLFIILPLIEFNFILVTPSVIGVFNYWVVMLLSYFYIFITHFSTDYITSRINAKL